jgi:hypothetical protein
LVKIIKKISYHSKKKGRFIMKAKYYTGILSLLLLSTSALKAQTDDSKNFRNDDAKLVVNNYYDDNDYYFASRINRFHRPYAMFDYYSPIYTDPFLYNHRPFSLGLNFIGGRGFGLGFSLNFPLINYGFGYGDYYGYDPLYGDDYYWGYDPYFYNGWYSPFMFSFNLNFNFWNRWGYGNHGWNGMSRYYRHNDYRRGYYSNNYSQGYNSTRYSSTGYTSRRNPGNNSENSIHNYNVSGRGISSTGHSGNVVNNIRPAARSYNNVNRGETRRNTYASLNNNRSGNIVNPGNNFGRYIRSNTAATTHSPRSISNPQVRSSTNRSMTIPRVHSFSRSMNSGFGTRSSSSHGGSRSSGSSRGKSSGRR